MSIAEHVGYALVYAMYSVGIIATILMLFQHTDNVQTPHKYKNRRRNYLIGTPVGIVGGALYLLMLTEPGKSVNAIVLAFHISVVIFMVATLIHLWGYWRGVKAQ